MSTGTTGSNRVRTARALGPRRSVVALLLATLLGLDLYACRLASVRVEPVAASASAAFAAARSEQRAQAPGWEERARAAASQALAAAPEWVAPRRLLDDIARTDLLGPASLAEHLTEVPNETASAKAARLYLAGRLEGMDGVSRFREAAAIDPSLAWAAHGLGWLRYQRGDPAGAMRHASRAMQHARDDWERSNFAITEARYLLGLDEPDEALSLLQSVDETSELAPGDRAALAAWIVRAELESDSESTVERGFWRGLDLITDGDLADDELVPLTSALRVAALLNSDFGSSADIEIALASRRSPARDRLRADLLSLNGESSPLALAMIEAEARPHAPLGGSRANLRAERIASVRPGDSSVPREVVEGWLAKLPQQALGSDGLPARPELAAVVRAARSDDVLALGHAMLAAGWFREARALAARIAASDRSALDAALELDLAAARPLSILSGIWRLLQRVDAGDEYAGPRLELAAAADSTSAAGHEAPAKRSDAGRSAEIDSLDELLAAMHPIFARHIAEAPDFGASPRLRYGSVAQVVHPGPRFSSADERAGRGTAGEPVGGLAEALGAMGRFGIFGQSFGGGGPDGSVLRLLSVEERHGEHLGFEYGGTVAWCEGADVPSRPVRLGANITGAALHEGYWIDVEGVRPDLEQFRVLETGFFTPDATRAERALAVEGPRLAKSSDAARVYAPLGEGDRIRLAILIERAPRADGGDRVTLEELLEVTARHEEGHLTDRGRFLPISAHPFRVLRFFASVGFSPVALGRRLEYRAQLIALCVADEPRIALAQCLDGAEGGGGITPHADAYAQLLADFLKELNRSRDEYEVLDTERYLIHQLHRLSGDDVRTVALELARNEGLSKE